MLMHKGKGLSPYEDTQKKYRKDPGLRKFVY